jgi:hypothetical protein
MRSLGYTKLLGLTLFAILIVFIIYILFNQYRKNEGFANTTNPTDEEWKENDSIIADNKPNKEGISAARMLYEDMGKKMYNDYSDTQSWFNLNSALPFGKKGDEELNNALKTGTYEANGNKKTAMDIRFDIPGKYTNKPVHMYKPEISRRVQMCESVKSWDCGAFNKDAFQKYCGICVSGGETSLGEKREETGLYIDPLVKKFIEDDAKKLNKQPLYVPSIGNCPAENFILVRPDCDYRKDRTDCSKATSLKERAVAEKCLSCLNPPSGRPTFVYAGNREGKETGYRLKAKPYTFDAYLRLATSQLEAKVTLVRQTNNEAVANMNKPGSGEILFLIKNTYENEPFELKVEYPSYAPYTFTDADKQSLNDILNSDLPKTAAKTNEATKLVCERDSANRFNFIDSDTMFYGCGAKTKCCKQIQTKNRYAIVGQLESVINSNRIQAFDLSIVNINGEPMDLMKGPPKFGDIKSSTVFLKGKNTAKIQDRMFWVWDKDSSMPIAIFSMVMPVTFAEATFPEDSLLCPKGPLVSSVEGEARLKTGACDKIVNGNVQGPGKFTEECIGSLFIQAGCLREGTGYPSTTLLKNALAYENGDRTKSPLDTDTIINNVQVEKNIADTQFRTGMDLKRIEEANMFCYGKFDFNPCQESISGNGPHSVECLDFLFRNAGKKIAGIGPTYLQSSDRSSGTDRNRETPVLYCNRQGAMAPINDKGQINYDAIDKANSVGSLKKVMSLYNDIHKKANFDLDKNVQDSAILECYGLTFDPTTSCGGKKVVTSKIPNGAIFKLAPSLSPGAYVMNSNGSLIVQGNISSNALQNTVFKSMDVPESRNGEIYIMNKNGAPQNGYLVVGGDGYKATLKPYLDDMEFKKSAKWKAVDSIANAPGEISLTPVSKPGFFLFYNKVDRSIYISNDLSSGKSAMTFKVLS